MDDEGRLRRSIKVKKNYFLPQHMRLRVLSYKLHSWFRSAVSGSNRPIKAAHDLLLRDSEAVPAKILGRARKSLIPVHNTFV